MRLKPVHDLVIIKAFERKQTSSGLHLPDSRDDREPGEGEVLAVGPGRTTDNGTLIVPTVERGQRVIYRRFAGHEVNVDGERYLVLPAGDILAVLEPHGPAVVAKEHSLKTQDWGYLCSCTAQFFVPKDATDEQRLEIARTAQAHAWRGL